ncbi:MAG: acetyl-CoA C-acyltransferase [Chitinophagaceae bacterium]|nr:MAG: acetyl-CoA C-acyltransferase [Chitinophagaceae bacterium]
MRDVFIVSAGRTPIGSFGGSLSKLTAVDLGAIVIKEAVKRAGIEPDSVQEVFMGNVISANVGQAPAKQAALKAGLSVNTPCTTINKVCASGMKAIMLAAQSVMLGDNDIVVAGGMESMSNIPYYAENARWGLRLGNANMVDGLLRDGLMDPYKGYHMGNAAEICAVDCNISREEQDKYAVEAYKRTAAAYDAGYFNDELVEVEVPQRKGDPIIVKEDEEYKKVNFDKIGSLRPAFKKDGTVTAANASKINDGAAAVVLMSKEMVEKTGAKPLAKIISYADASQDPEQFTTTPAKAMPKAIEKGKLNQSDIDYFEINEAFSVVSLANIQKMKLDPSKVNVFGGAVSIGHPIGVSGARIIITLISVLNHKNGKLGCAGICNGGGGASAMVIEKI